MKLIFNPSGPEHRFKAHILSGYVDVAEPGMVEVTKEQAEILTKDYPDNFSWPAEEKAEAKPKRDKAARKPGRNKGGGA
jgi:hypothetical protein